jgi:hypothetical protein
MNTAMNIQGLSWQLERQVLKEDLNSVCCHSFMYMYPVYILHSALITGFISDHFTLICFERIN